MMPTDAEIVNAIDDVLKVLNNSSLMLLINSDIFEDRLTSYKSGDYAYEKAKDK